MFLLVSDCPHLQTIIFGKKSFHDSKELKLKSILLQSTVT